MSEPLEARVIRLDAKGCLVSLDEPHADLPGDGRVLWCGVRGRIHLRDRTGQKSPVVVGDRVQVERTQEDRGAVVGVHPRRSTLSRPDLHKGHVEHVMAANVDQVVVVSGAAEPAFSPGLVDRILAVIEYSELEAVIVVNKMDLVDDPPYEVETYRELGYTVLLTSAEDGRGIEDLRAALRGKVSVATGHSGVGKSSLLNVLDPALTLDVGTVNVVTRRGKHTTTAAVWIPFGTDGAVVDTAGVREFGLFGIPKRDVPWLFRDIARVAPACRYPDCLHLHEPSCAVDAAVESGEITAFRYESYLRILEGLDEVR
jgi:ribosome biogenesis GTPase